MWTIESIAARRATGDALVTVADWCCSFETGSYFDSAKLSLRRYAQPGFVEIEHDVRDGETFATSDEAEAYALNAGRLQWFRDCPRRAT